MKIINKLQTGNKLKYGTKEYRKAYNEERLARKVGDTYALPILEEVVVRPKDYNPVGQAISRKLHNIGNSISKTAISFTPYSPIIAGIELGASFVPGSSNYGDTKNAAINAGLEVTPLGLSKGLKVLSKYYTKGLPRIGKHNIAESINVVGDTPHSAQNKAMLEAITNYNNTMYTNGTLAEPMANRAKKLGFDTKVSRIKSKTTLIDENSSIYDFGDFIKEGRRNKLLTRRNTKGIAGNTSGKGDIILFRRDPKGVMYSPSEIAETASHESLHRIQSKTGWTLDKPSNGYYTANENNPVAAALKPYLAPDKWAQSADEVWADLHAFRMSNNIGARDLTDDEAMNAVIQLARHWDMSKFSTQAINSLKKALQALPASTGLYLGSKLIPRNETK